MSAFVFPQVHQSGSGWSPVVSFHTFALFARQCALGHVFRTDMVWAGSTFLNPTVDPSTSIDRGILLGSGNTGKVRDWQTVSVKGQTVRIFSVWAIHYPPL